LSVISIFILHVSAALVNACYVSRRMERIHTADVTLKAIQGH